MLCQGGRVVLLSKRLLISGCLGRLGVGVVLRLILLSMKCYGLSTSLGITGLQSVLQTAWDSRNGGYRVELVSLAWQRRG